MDFKNNILPAFLTTKKEAINPFEKFDIKLFRNILTQNSIPLCAICLTKCRLPSIPNGCTHNFCFQCIKIWSKTKKSCPLCRRYFDKIIRC